MKPVVKYALFFFGAVVLLNVWFMAAGSDAQFKSIYSAMAGVFSAIVIEGRKKNRQKRRKNDKGDL